MTEDQLSHLRRASSSDCLHLRSTAIAALTIIAHIDAQAARIAALEHMAAAWIGRAYDRSRVDQATFAADLTSEELAVWRTDPEIAAALDATWEGYVNDHA